MLGEVALLAKQQVDFGFETTLSGRGHLNLVRRLKDQGYRIHFFFLWVSGVDLALSRIRDRVSEGGHNVPEVDVRRRFERSLRNFLVHYRPLADSWALFDNSKNIPSVIAMESEGGLHIIDTKAYTMLIKRYE